MSNQAESTAWLVGDANDGNVVGVREVAAAPDTLIRTMGGHITAWSPGMQRRYGFTSMEACGQVSHGLLRTIFPQALPAIETVLVGTNTWSGGSVNRHADGHAVMTINHWYVHRGDAHDTLLVTEVHSALAQEREDIRQHLADLMMTLAHELSEPLTAVGSYVAGSQRTLQLAWPDLANLRVALGQASTQVARGVRGVNLLRELASGMRGTG